MLFAAALKRDGRFAAFTQRRKELEATGLAKSLAWRAAAKEFGWSTFDFDEPVFPPAPVQQPPPAAPPAPSPKERPSSKEGPAIEDEDGSEEDYAALAERSKAAGTQPLDDLRWAYENHVNPKVRVADAPSVGAWGFLQFAKNNQSKFMEMCGKHLLKSESEDEKALADDKRKHFAVIDRLLAETEGACPACGRTY